MSSTFTPFEAPHLLTTRVPAMGQNLNCVATFDRGYGANTELAGISKVTVDRIWAGPAWKIISLWHTMTFLVSRIRLVYMHCRHVLTNLPMCTLPLEN